MSGIDIKYVSTYILKYRHTFINMYVAVSYSRSNSFVCRFLKNEFIDNLTDNSAWRLNLN